MELFEKQDQCVPMSQNSIQEMSIPKQLTLHRKTGGIDEPSIRSIITEPRLSESKGIDASKNEDPWIGDYNDRNPNERSNVTHLLKNFLGRDCKNRVISPEVAGIPEVGVNALSKDKQKLVRKLSKNCDGTNPPVEYDSTRKLSGAAAMGTRHSVAVDDFNERIAEQQSAVVAKPDPHYGEECQFSSSDGSHLAESPSSRETQDASDRMHPGRNLTDVATVTIGSKKTTVILESSLPKQLPKQFRNAKIPSTHDKAKTHANDASWDNFNSSMRSFAAPKSELIKTIGRPPSKSYASIDYSEDGLKSQVLEGPLSTGSASVDDGGYQDPTGNDRSDAEDSSFDTDQIPLSCDANHDSQYIEEEELKAREDAKVAELIRQAEEQIIMPSQDNRKRAHQILKGAGQRTSTADLIQVIDASVERIDTQLSRLSDAIRRTHQSSDLPFPRTSATADESSPEEHLSLTVSKADFADMHISGQFNLGFILATRKNADLFIVDQHASDEKYNFERLQANTVVQHQRLVQARTLRLTAIEEEIILEYKEALLNNGFLVDVDTSDDCRVGQRCKLISLPMSREVTFDVTDLEELISILAETPASASMGNVPRPSKVRRMFAMRACRSSIMVGKTLTLKQMGVLVSKMGSIDKPWNCPHGRPTMRHLCRLDAFETWDEGDGLVGMEEEGETVEWKRWHTEMMERREGTRGEDQDDNIHIEVNTRADGGDEKPNPSDE